MRNWFRENVSSYKLDLSLHMALDLSTWQYQAIAIVAMKYENVDSSVVLYRCTALEGFEQLLQEPPRAP